ncbi:hypothetical protein [Polyangium mundeleinium]|uniref:Uncharacterized protein n=1 Tax=Polyangium mundeleinium TaxID=2995306 RepID=A0ABT5F132_9BACT|nr:hypothetical protein [Polyangium mundeleinium]MDC0747153.1 hypothetical protein [Polyangium mundeleinium]
MPPRVFLPLASAAFAALGATAARAAPPPPPAPSAAPASDSAPAAGSVPAPAPPATLGAPPPAPPWAQPSWMQRPPPWAYGPYPGWRLEDEGKASASSTRQWYGAKTLLGLIPSDVVFTLGYVLTFSSHSTEDIGVVMVGLGAAGHCLTAPIVHWVHGNVGRGFLSLGLNVGLPVVSAMIADVSDARDMTIPLVLLSVVAWPVVDIAVLSYAESEPEPKRKRTSAMPSFTVLPMIDRDKQGLSLAGQF